VNIDDIAKYVWENSQTIDFGSVEVWPEDLFKKKWAKGQPFEDVWNTSGTGWYWFLLDMTYDELHQIPKPSSLPKNGCNIGLTAHDNREVFKNSLLCKADNSGMIVVYNGHENNVTTRIRSHFALNNDKTGALGLNHYPLSKKKWQVKLFSMPCFQDISADDKRQIEFLMNAPTGRCAVESAWRAKYGWPILCKE